MLLYVCAMPNLYVQARRGWLAVILLMVLPAAARAHIELDASVPAARAVITAPPDALRLRFSGTVEARYTRLMLLAPDGAQVPLGAITFLDGSDREFTAAVPPLRGSGTFTVRWRTAGADGHVLEGSYTFTLVQDSAGVFEPDTAGATVVVEDHEHDHGGASMSGTGPGEVVGRWLHFVALTLLLGAVTLRMALLPRLGSDAATRSLLERRAWRAIALAAVLLGGAAILRLWQQSVALHGASRAWSTPLLTMMLNDTGWGRAWVLQVFLLTLVAAAIVWARPSRDRVAALVATLAAAGLAAIPGLSGHAAGAGGIAWLVLSNDALHVAAAGAWVGTLALLMTAVLPVLGRTPDGPVAQAAAVDAFSPLALAAAAVVAGSGLVNALLHFSAPAQLWTTTYGLTLLVKLTLVGAALAGGFVNWRFVRPRLTTGGHARLRVVAGSELFFALFVLLATAVLTGLPRPG
ncbi:MAG TPA: copper resistance protein CopC [Longimicrobiales bacterium]|nr:copper resistance protein CopC [Longimicrobiales bacterium]